MNCGNGPLAYYSTIIFYFENNQHIIVVSVCNTIIIDRNWSIFPIELSFIWNSSVAWNTRPDTPFQKYSLDWLPLCLLLPLCALTLVYLHVDFYLEQWLDTFKNYREEKIENICHFTLRLCGKVFFELRSWETVKCFDVLKLFRAEVSFELVRAKRVL